MYPLAQIIGHAVYAGLTEDAHGNETKSWAEPVDVAVFAYAPSFDSSEPGGTQVITGLQVFAPQSLEVDPRDQFVVEGDRYEVEGEIGDWTKGPFGFQPGIVIHLKKVTGGV